MASVVILDDSKNRIEKVTTKDYPKTKITYGQRLTKINEVLPFRVRFTTIGIPSAYSSVPGIGLQIIGVNNYIL